MQKNLTSYWSTEMFTEKENIPSKVKQIMEKK